MQIKKFSAPTLKEAAQKMKDALGGEAIILGTRIIESAQGTDGNGGKIKQKLFELTAGIEKEKPAFVLADDQIKHKNSDKANGKIKPGKRNESFNTNANYENEIAQLKKMIYKHQRTSLSHDSEKLFPILHRKISTQTLI
jgi:flagellar biosynthesis GTPase FlhF